MAHRMDELLQAVDERLDEDLSIKTLAGMGYLSPVQLYRDFYSTTGHTVSEYIRKRRLSKALALIKLSKMTLKDIAYACGYSSQQSMCRSVKAATGQTPLGYKHGSVYFCFPRSLPYTGLTITVATETLPDLTGFAFYHKRLSGIENMAVKNLLSLIPGYRGRIFGRNGKQSGSLFCYELYIPADENSPALDGSVFTPIAPLPGSTKIYARTTVKNVETKIAGAWDSLASSWLKTSMFEQAEESYLEEYLFGSGKAKRLTLYLSVKRRAGIQEINLVQYDEIQFLSAKGRGPDGEANASKAVMAYLHKNDPSLASSADCFYVSVSDGVYVCGVRLIKPPVLPPESGLTLLTIPKGEYAMLKGDCCLAGVYDHVLAAWARENGFTIAGAPFSIYSTEKGFMTKQITMRTLILLKNDKP